MFAIETKTTVGQTMLSYLSEIASTHGNSAAQLAQKFLYFFRTYVDQNAVDALDVTRTQQFVKSGETFCKWASPDLLPDFLIRFYRVNLLRELITDSDLRNRVLCCTLDYFHQMEETGMISAETMKKAAESFERISILEKQAYAATCALEKQFPQKKRFPKNALHIPYARHDVEKIDATNVWLKIWEPNIQPYGQVIGPIDVGSSTISLIEVGWIITCSIAKSKEGGFKIAEPGPIYPSLPFNE